MAFPQGWQEVCLISVTRAGSSASIRAAAQFAAITESIDISEPDYPGESIPNTAGGRVWKQTPQEDGEITLEMYPIEASAGDAENNKGLFQQFAGTAADAAYDTAEPISTLLTATPGVDRTRSRFRVTVLWTNDDSGGTPPTTAEEATAASTDSLRFSAMGCRLISHKADFTDGILKVTATFKYPAMNKAGDVKMSRWDSGAQTAITALSAYDDEDSWT
ncbi:MAG: hypothetical protein CL811_06655 [Colwelliaceae bacterium]|jgi:hypothetical protein|nr:hypothetical protein [Colwelliaceae bacterium]|tara:strand:- start:402 stop:1058 length:657 start_codon:yes stop_codon:yes gene_type:complete